ncbi:MAG: hypothetical protein AB2653_15115 [Candidatus Thiodiazotropha endolucinida]
MSDWESLKKRIDASYPYRLEKYRPDIFEENKEKRLLIVVHGYSDHVYSMHWLMEILGDQLAQTYVVYQYSFETKFLGKNYLSLELAARELGNEIKRVIQEDKLITKHAAFVGHSTGGLVARRAFLDNRSLFSSARFVFLGSPHYGSEAADLKNKFVKGDKQTQELAPASDFVWRLNRDWSDLPKNYIQRVLSVIGTKSTRRRQWGLPKGRWKQADGVVRSTSAVSSILTSKSYLIFVPLDHTELAQIPEAWKELRSLRKNSVRKPPNVSRDISIIATIMFLRDYKISNHSDLWLLCVNMFEVLEQSYRTTLLRHKHGWVENENGGWEPGEYRNQNIVDLGLSDDDKDYIEPIVDPERFVEDQPPTVPEFVDGFKEYLEQSREFWTKKIFGTLILRIDYVDIPPEPSIRYIKCHKTNKVISIPDGSFLRCGKRWATLWLPTIYEGFYEVAISHGNQLLSINVDIQSHFVTAIEVDINSGQCKVLCTDIEVLRESVTNGFKMLEQELDRKEWNIKGDLPRVIRVSDEE